MAEVTASRGSETETHLDASNVDVDDDTRRKIRKTLNIAMDVVSVGQRGASFGFRIAKSVTDKGFQIASASIRKQAEVLEEAVGENIASQALHSVNEIVDVAHQATHAGQQLAQSITDASLSATRAGLAATGAKEGELLRLAIGERAADEVMSLDSRVRQFSSGIPDLLDLPELFSTAQAWGVLQKAWTETQQPHASPEQGVLPAHSERWMRYAGAAFGASWLAGMVEGPSLTAITRTTLAATGENGGLEKAALAAAGIEGNVDMIAFKQPFKELFEPGYLVAVDYTLGYVVVAFRGTSTIGDVLADLACETVPINTGGREGFAHDGMLRAAKHMAAALAPLVEEGLAKLFMHNGPRVIITGHSMGAGVAALLMMLWSDSNRFPDVPIECVAYACPQILDADTAMAQRVHTVSVIVGDDFVPRFSLATAIDLRGRIACLHDPEAYGLSSSYNVESVRAAEQRGDVDQLAHIHSAVSVVVGKSENRLFPAGMLIHLNPGRAAEAIDHDTIDEIFVSKDMAKAHLPPRYLAALRAPSLTSQL
eukprot:gnl/MRDRNA2_/MRDRNA2_30937_c0_seq1.p1 gnl/MRDRNA2_/MRDRNA2_30937_c0~~gnl/MRDRNA2_/MRDRNA2_30937_c0_seq1.p1  ORF type:complete len:540 (-),score=113.02 gnl/MRDRNA2_/MRDRNA2_30937_c0_seq1:45-1664(-)